MRFIPQKRHNQCATACMRMILCASGKKINNKDKLSGNSFFAMRNYLQENGIEVVSGRKIDNLLYRLDYPYMIINIKGAWGYHYAVIERINAKESLIYDPGRIRVRKVKPSQIIKNWNGYFLALPSVKLSSEKPSVYLFCTYPFLSFYRMIIVYLLMLIILIILSG